MNSICQNFLVVACLVLSASAIQGQGSSSFAYASASSQVGAIQNGGQQQEAFSQSLATAFTGNNQGYARAMASALVSGIQQRGCGYYQQVITEARAIASSDGNGNSFAEAIASVQVINQCYQSYGFSSSSASANAQAGNSGGGGFGSGRKMLTTA